MAASSDARGRAWVATPAPKVALEVLGDLVAGQWGEVIAAYGGNSGLYAALPAVLVQGLLSMSDSPEESRQAVGWTERIEEAARRMSGSA